VFEDQPPPVAQPDPFEPSAGEPRGAARQRFALDRLSEVLDAERVGPWPARKA